MTVNFPKIVFKGGNSIVLDNQIKLPLMTVFSAFGAKCLLFYVIPSTTILIFDLLQPERRKYSMDYKGTF